MPPIDTPAIVLNIRHAVETYHGDIGLPANKSRWPRHIWVNTDGPTKTAVPMKNLLSVTPLPNVPAPGTLNRAISFITAQVPTIRAEWFGYSPDDFQPAIRAAVAQHRQESDNRAIEAEKDAPPSPYGAAESLQQFAHSALVGSEFGPQTLARSFVGEYLIFRLIVSSNEWSVAHMIVHSPLRRGGPCWFETCSPRADDDLEEPVVCGLFFEPPTRPRQFFTVGRHVDTDGLGQQQATVELRTAYFLYGRRPGVDVQDLFGIRLGPGRHRGEPRAYGIWCARLKKWLSADDRRRLIAQFPIEDNDKLDGYREYVEGLDGILAWVSAQQHLSLQRPAIR